MVVIGSFLVAAVISFWGSILLGLVNTAVIQTALNESRNKALKLAFGGTLAEIPYSLIPVFFASRVSDIEQHKIAIGLVVGVVLLAYGGSILYKHYKSIKPGIKEVDTTTKYPVIKGLSLGLINPQLIFFWAGIVVLIETGTFTLLGNKIADLSSIYSKFAFSLGAMAGALGILVIYAFLASRFKEVLLSIIGTRLNKLVGWFFILFGLFALVKNVI